jgi:hypothetical protein
MQEVCRFWAHASSEVASGGHRVAERLAFAVATSVDGGGGGNVGGLNEARRPFAVGGSVTEAAPHRVTTSMCDQSPTEADRATVRRSDAAGRRAGRLLV